MNNTKKLSKKAIVWLVIGGLFLISLPFTLPQVKPASKYVGNFVQEKILQTKSGAGDTFVTTQDPPGDGAPADGTLTGNPSAGSAGGDSPNIDYSYKPSTQKPTNPDTKKTPAPVPDAPDVVLETRSSVDYLNSVRAEGGKGPLIENAVANGWALNHTKNMIAAGGSSGCGVYHQVMSDFFDKDIGPILVSGMAENVGRAGTYQTVLVGLKNSPGHYHNMMGDYKYVGNGPVKVNTGPCKGNVYTTQLFVR